MNVLTVVSARNGIAGISGVERVRSSGPNVVLDKKLSTITSVDTVVVVLEVIVVNMTLSRM